VVEKLRSGLISYSAGCVQGPHLGAYQSARSGSMRTATSSFTSHPFYCQAMGRSTVSCAARGERAPSQRQPTQSASWATATWRSRAH
jgi:hypothetical protein